MTANKGRGRRFLAVAFNIIVIAGLLSAGVAAAVYFQKTAPTTKRAARQTTAPLVEVAEARKTTTEQIIEAMGVVEPAREIELVAEVEGTVKALSSRLVPGGLVHAGEIVVELDDRDYVLDVRLSEVGVTTAEADLAIEQGQQVVAREEAKLLSSGTGARVQATELSLRKPQLLKAEADLASARTDLEKARLDLARTKVKAPFNALVTSLDVNLGSRVSTQSSLATLVGTDEYWIEASLPMDRLSRLDLEREGGIPVRISRHAGDETCPGTFCQGRLVRLAGTLSTDTRMAKAIVSVRDPLGLEQASENGTLSAHKPLLILGEYVSLEIEGRPLEDVIEIPRQALRDENKIWLAKDGVLEIRPVEPVWKSEDHVYLRDGLAPGERVVVSEITAPLPGMKVLLPGEEEAAPEPGATPAGLASGKGGPGALGQTPGADEPGTAARASGKGGEPGEQRRTPGATVRAAEANSPGAAQ